jgi:hypothetical protein
MDCFIAVMAGTAIDNSVQVAKKAARNVGKMLRQ